MDLFFCHGWKGLQVCCTGGYQAEGSPGVEDYCLALRATHADNPLLSQSFRKIQAAVHTQSVVLLPEGVCEPGNMEELFATYASRLIIIGEKRPPAGDQCARCLCAFTTFSAKPGNLVSQL